MYCAPESSHHSGFRRTGPNGITWQADIVREYAREDQFVTTCLSYSRPQLADEDMVQALDVTAGNPYYLMQDGLSADVEVQRVARPPAAGGVAGG